jgi:hypothetical protein
MADQTFPATGAAGRGRSPLARLLRDNGLTLVLAAIFLAALAGQLLTGWASHNEELARHGAAPLPLARYLVSGEFASAVFENWESEFLQMSAYVILTAVLFQRGSAESRDPDEEPADEGEAGGASRGLARWLYAHSLGLALLLLFAGSFVAHWLASWRAAMSEAALHGDAPHGALAHLVDAGFWFESFQNWQSEFLSTAVLVVLTIFLRQKGSPESKPVDASNAETGG